MSNKEFIKKTKKQILNKYQNSTFSINDIKFRKKIQNQILNFKVKSDNNYNSCKCCRYYLIEFKKINNNKFLKFYKKFNVNLKLFSLYDKKLRPQSKKEVCLKTYLIFSKLIFKNRLINNAQKLNTILKINDKILIKYSKKKHSNLIKEIKKNFLIEENLIRYFL
tara:strand:- start:8356 stop:8850 length:495 start_codon:yes stop_codon:yes gene_type:complete